MRTAKHVLEISSLTPGAPKLTFNDAGTEGSFSGAGCDGSFKVAN